MVENKKGIILQLRKVNGVNNDYIRELASIIVKYQKEIKVLALQEKYDKDICFTFINAHSRINTCKNQTKQGFQQFKTQDEIMVVYYNISDVYFYW